MNDENDELFQNLNLNCDLVKPKQLVEIRKIPTLLKRTIEKV